MAHQSLTGFFTAIAGAALVFIGIIWISAKHLKPAQAVFIRSITFALLLDILSEPAESMSGELLEAIFHLGTAIVLFIALWRYSKAK